MNNIVFYIHRTGLLGYFINPICEFLSKRYNITILHLDKCNGYTFAPKESPLYQLIDISDKSVNEIVGILSDLRPKAFISPGFISIYELLMLRICVMLKIKTFYLEHGLYSKETASLPFGKLINKFASTVKKNLYFLFRYSQFIWLSENSAHEMSVFWNCFRKKRYDLSRFDKALFFSEYGYRKIDEMFHYNKRDVDFICYPLSKSDNEFRKYQEIAKIPLPGDKKATYIHQSFILDSLVKWSYQDEKEYIVGIADHLREYGYSLQVQLHPRSDYEMYRKMFEDTDIEIVKGMSREDFKRFSLVVGHYSTALLYSIFFRIPILILDYPGVMKAEDSPFFPVSCKLPITDTEALMKRYETYIREYMGTGICSFENIARKLENTIKHID